jgi:hypothetical protein
MLEFCSIASIINVDYSWGMHGLPTLSPLHNSLVLGIVQTKVRVHRGLDLGGLNESNFGMESSSLVFEGWVVQVCINCDRCKLIFYKILLFEFLPVLHSIIKTVPPFLQVILEKRRRARVSRSGRFQ